uniref:Uncharacterized protein n=1 Tax=Glossina pallidipes TaxID=7398 RepID=A0A1A9Z907_GLOPL
MHDLLSSIQIVLTQCNRKMHRLIDCYDVFHIVEKAYISMKEKGSEGMREREKDLSSDYQDQELNRAARSFKDGAQFLLFDFLISIFISELSQPNSLRIILSIKSCLDPFNFSPGLDSMDGKLISGHSLCIPFEVVGFSSSKLQ